MSGPGTSTVVLYASVFPSAWGDRWQTLGAVHVVVAFREHPWKGERPEGA